MEIWINQEKINFVLNDEKTLKDVVVSIDKWANGHQLILYSLKVDNKEIINFFNTKFTQEFCIDQVKHIECIVLSDIAYTVHILRDIKTDLNYFDFLNEENFANHVKQFNTYFDYIKEAIQQASKILNFQKEFLYLKQSIKDLEIEFFKVKKNELSFSQSKFKPLIERIVAIIDDSFYKFNYVIMQSFLSKEKYAFKHLIENSLQFLEQTKKQLLESAINFQKNRTAFALQQFVEIINGIELIIVIMDVIKDKFLKDKDFKKIKNEFDEHYSKLNDFFKSIKNSLEKKDYIEISDILEYEIKEIFPLIKDNFEQLFQNSKKIGIT